MTTTKKKPGVPAGKSQNKKKPAVKKPNPANKEAKKPIGKPTTYTRPTADAILEQLQNGIALTRACKSQGIEHGTFLGWVADDRDGLSDRFARARELGCHAMAYDLVEILDTPAGINPVSGAVDTGEVQNRRLQFDGKMRLLGKWLPKVYGDKLELGGELKVGVAEAIREARERAAKR